MKTTFNAIVTQAEGKKATGIPVPGNAVAALGVGRNMVTSIQFWLKSFGLLDEELQTTPIADTIFAV